MTEVYVLADDKVRKRGFLAEHGLSLFIKHGDKNIIFDVGQSDVCLRNAREMEIDIDRADYILLSHGHYDHCGGLEFFSEENFDGSIPIYADRMVFEKKYALNSDGSHRDIGIPVAVRDNDFFIRNFVEADGILEISPGVVFLRAGQSHITKEDSSKGLYVERNGKLLKDKMNDEHMLVLIDQEELMIFLGCSHPGIINCIDNVLKVFPDKKIKALFAGMHLESASPEFLKSVIEYFEQIGIEHIYPLHCTGIRAISEIKNHFDVKCSVLYAGDSVTI